MTSQDLPHHYSVAAATRPGEHVQVTSAGLPSLESAPPPQYGGPEGFWSPETLLVAAVADCLILTFRGVARAARLDWSAVRCEVDGTLDKQDGVTRFTHFAVRASLDVPEGTDEAKAARLLEKAEQGCLVTNSLSAESDLVTEVRVVHAGD